MLWDGRTIIVFSVVSKDCCVVCISPADRRCVRRQTAFGQGWVWPLLCPSPDLQNTPIIQLCLCLLQSKGLTKSFTAPIFTALIFPIWPNDEWGYLRKRPPWIGYSETVLWLVSRVCLLSDWLEQTVGGVTRVDHQMFQMCTQSTDAHEYQPKLVE